MWTLAPGRSLTEPTNNLTDHCRPTPHSISFITPLKRFLAVSFPLCALRPLSRQSHRRTDPSQIASTTFPTAYKYSLLPVPKLATAIMDVVLEGFDTFLFDRLYSTIFPATPGAAAYNAFKDAANATISSLGEAPTSHYNDFQYRPASQYMSFEPSSYAYTSSWARDDVARQAFSLFLITWYVTWTMQSP